MKPSKNRLKVLLFVSVMVNVFFVGFVVSSHHDKPMDRRPPPPPHERGPMPQFEQAKKNLSEDGRAIVERILDEQRLALRGDKGKMRDYIHDAERILLAPELDKQALIEAHENIDAYGGEMKAAISDVIYQIAVQLSPEDRVLFFQNALPKRPPPRR